MKKRALLMCCALAAATAAHAQKPCSPADAAAAQKVVDKIVSWQSLEKAWRDYHHCDTGPVEDGFTDALMRLMVGWKNVDVAASTLSKDAQFKDWVYKRLLSPTAKDDREDVYALAKKSCPRGQDAFCSELADMIKPAKAEPLAPLSLDPIKPIGAK